MNTCVPHLWGLSFMNCRIMLCRLRDEFIASSNDNTDGTLYPCAHVFCSVSTTDLTFHVRSVSERASLLSVKCRFCMILSKPAFETNCPNVPLGIAPTPIVTQ
ncbi:hypothetical protein PHMEG_00013716 [Phytophthora megakarya]|uniref:Uncharacterized protein n=1 Tax=Phytophthora megakarya TaxID=4795 RepID=A0A225W5N9_9STRA|nr:hypothetical protein PHMEG_00013716 [Phytophthora megakarya]